MKSYWLGFWAFAIILFASCDKSDDNTTVTAVDFKSPAFLVGNWKMVGSYQSDGGPQYYVDVSDGEMLKFSGDGTFTSSRYPECSEGKYSVDDDKLTFTYNCEAFNARFPELDGKFVYTIGNDSGKLILNPVTLFCVEGCSYYYKKISK